jgi:K+-transporting ATPase ATPase C chain
MSICCVIYTLLVLLVGQTIAPWKANGSLVHNEKGEIIGSELIAQRFIRPEYLWPRPSAVDYNAAASGGSNLSPANPELRSRAESIMVKMGNNKVKIPADLVTASGSGLDPYISLKSAEFQVERIALARRISAAVIQKILLRCSSRLGGIFMDEPLIDVLLVNMELDRLGKHDE